MTYSILLKRCKKANSIRLIRYEVENINLQGLANLSIELNVIIKFPELRNLLITKLSKDLSI